MVAVAGAEQAGLVSTGVAARPTVHILDGAGRPVPGIEARTDIVTGLARLRGAVQGPDGVLSRPADAGGARAAIRRVLS